jgi:transcriptional regulator with XRE-family HTH domain
MLIPLSLPVKRAVAKLGGDLARARRRRHLPQASLAERSGISLRTLQHLEKGNPRVGLEPLARVLYVLGELHRLEHLLDTAEDSLGLTLMDEALPKRVRKRRSPNAL